MVVREVRRCSTLRTPADRAVRRGKPLYADAPARVITGSLLHTVLLTRDVIGSGPMQGLQVAVDTKGTRT